MSTAPQPSTQGSQDSGNSDSTAEKLREKVREANAQSEVNRLIKGGK